MNEIVEAMSRFVEPPELKEGDYIGEDGLIYCGICREPKQLYQPPGGLLFPDGAKIKIMCKCEIAERDRRFEEEASRQLRERIALNRANCFRAGAGRYSAMTFENADGGDELALLGAKTFCERFDEFTKLGKGLLFFGSVGSGKTFLAACIANRLLDEGKRVIFTNLPRIVNRLQASFEGRNELLDELNSVPLLILDDLRAERKTEFMSEALFNVIDGRYNSGLPLIVTTNLSGKELKQTSGDLTLDRVTSRLLEICHPIEVTGQDRRREILKSTFADTAALLGLTAGEKTT